MMKMGFDNKLINMIMKCVEIVTFSVLINGEPKSPIVPSRGLTYGDPLSPYLFLLCTERLISLLRTTDKELQF